MAEYRKTVGNVEIVSMTEKGSLVNAGHFPEPGFGRLVRSGGRRRWQPE